MSRRHSFRWIAALFAAITLLAACGDSDDGGDTGSGSGGSGSGDVAAADVEDLVDEGKLTVCSDIPYAPFEFEEDGELKGVDVDLMKAIAEELGLEAEFRDTDFDGIFASLAAGNCDVIASSVSITDERKEANNFSAGYFEIQQSVLARKEDGDKYKDVAALKGTTIGVQSETTGADAADAACEEVDCEVKEFTGADELFTALKAKQVDVVLQDLPVNAYHAETSGDSVIANTLDDEEAEQYGFVVPKDKPKLLEAIDAALQTLRDNGEYDRILEEYLGDAATKS